jgi:quercetin dioxygenase-like cupin family protein
MTNDIAEFLTSRRARITPERAGLPTYGKRRVPGVRREDVASLAGVSIEYYKRLERGHVIAQGGAPMEITRSSIDTAKGPGTWFTGDVYIDAVAAAPAPARVQANLVHFTPGARTHWHTHPLGQTIYVTEGLGLCQRRGGPVELIRPGDRVFFAPDEDHWHGAAPNRFMAHLALNEVDDDHPAVDWGEAVTDDEYAAAPAG